jgi:hypothetical protein
VRIGDMIPIAPARRGFFLICRRIQPAPSTGFSLGRSAWREVGPDFGCCVIYPTAGQCRTAKMHSRLRESCNCPWLTAHRFLLVAGTTNVGIMFRGSPHAELAACRSPIVAAPARCDERHPVCHSVRPGSTDGRVGISAEQDAGFELEMGFSSVRYRLGLLPRARNHIFG